jgi:hypothetical protein
MLRCQRSPPRRHVVGQSAGDAHESSRIGTSPRAAITGTSTLRPSPERGRRPVQRVFSDCRKDRSTGFGPDP